ncbi:MAG: hypothetical protein AAF127_05845 [Pseudomonadota bacterium]
MSAFFSAVPLRLAAFASLCSLIAACSGAPDTVDADNAAAIAKADPPGAALPLSIGGRVAAEGEDAVNVSVNCAAALEQTAEKLASMTDNPRSAEIAMIRQAEDYFSAEAESDIASAGIPGSAAAAIARRKGEKADAVTEQAQLAIACLRRYGDEVEGQSGAAL